MNNILVEILDERYIKLSSQREISQIVLKEFSTDNNSKLEIENGRYIYILPLLSYNSFIIRCISEKFGNIVFENEIIKDKILESAEATQPPVADLMNDRLASIKTPSFPNYIRLLSLLGAKNQMLTLWTVPLTRLYEIYRYFKIWKHPFLPSIEMSELLSNKIRETFSENEPSVEELFNITFTELATIKTAMGNTGKWRLKPEGFDKLKYKSAVDLLLAKPRSYQDRSNLTTFQYAPFGEKSYVKCVIKEFSSLPNGSGKLKLYDGYTEVEIFMYGVGWQTQLYRPGDTIVIEVVRIGPNKFNGNSIISEEEVKAIPILPNYRNSPSNNITNKILVNSTQELLLRYNGEHLFDYVTGAQKSFWESIEHLHFPQDVKDFSNTLESLAYYELLCLQLIFLENKKNSENSIGIPKICENPKMLNDSLDNFGFTPTNGQSKAIKEIITSLKSDRAEKILLSGDVGSGKSLVANSACFYTVDSGFQAALVGPTEILAKQLYDGIMKQIDKMTIKPTVAYLSGNTKAKEKREIESLVKKGLIDIVVGTHSVLNLEYNNLGLLVVDEQQKFGKKQREALNLSRPDGRTIDVLEQTATPIPQTTALAFYGDIKLITLTEKPGGRKENITKWIKKSSNEFLMEIFNPVWEHVFKEIEAGHQIFIVTPAVDEGSKSASVQKTTKILKSKFPNIVIDSIHGGMKKDKQSKSLELFRENKTNVLIASSIVEVGIDIPNSTIMMVLDANRFGASSLHQIRGRVGRSDLQGYCYLIADDTTSNSQKRLQALVDSNNGFDIALVDLETRNTGNLFGLQQSGASNLKFCNLINHSSMIEQAQFEAENIYNSPNKDKAISDAKAFLRFEEEEE